MKTVNNFLFLILLFCAKNSFSQTFRNGFYNREYSSGGGNGQGASFQSNIGSSLHNNESVFLISSQDSISNSAEKKWSVYFGGGANYRLPPTLFTWWEPIFTLRAGIDALIFRRIHSWGYLGTGFSYIQYSSKAKWINGLGLYNESRISNSIMGIPIIYSLDIYPNVAIYPTVHIGFALTKLLKNTSEIIYSNGITNKNIEYQSGSTSIFFLGAVCLNFRPFKSVTVLLSLDYLQQNKSYQKSATNIDFGMDFAKIFRLGAGMKYEF